jgi:hypothetical protein
VEQEVLSHFYTFQEPLETKIAEYLQKKHVKFRPLAVSLRVVGPTEEDARPMIVVSCSAIAIKKVERFLNKSYIREIYHGPESREIRFEYLVIELRPRADEIVDEVFVERLQPTNDGIWNPRIKVMQVGVSQLATLGGLVCVIDSSGTESAYGLTVGHVLQPTSLYDDNAHHFSKTEDYGSNDSASDSDESESTTESDNEVLDQSTLNDTASADENEPLNEQEWPSLGHISQASYSERARNRDWALVELEALSRPQTELSSISATWRYEAARAFGMEVVSLGSEIGCHYNVSKLPARAVLPSGRASAFVDMQVLHHANEEG